ncbi:E3 ubiquitin/ISG15 ligase TRIM25-like isoform X4 [Clarias gariepinus]|uniref:E3 ubiquitin/ISG15 ligase TRIM25-like isoform X4 n=1 Tax=Clarias gariepinus TaxID=13013 RepID=UPI00234D0876|nr:E3 ubiquitin/ISG15 ligase TRIM25-like isoform X4 [Clarias gariepinus]
MTEARILDHLSVDQFTCSVCLDLLKDPVTIPCGHSFCKMCINDCWDKEDEKGVYSCPQCRDTFTPRSVLRRNNMLAELMEKLGKAGVRAASPTHFYAGPGDVECEICTGRKHKALKSCLMCLTSFCETHLKHHLEIPGLKKHTLVEASSNLQEKICSQHGKPIEIYCRTDQICICSLCMLDNHKVHDMVSISAERTEKQRELKAEQMKSHQRIQQKQKKVDELKQAVITIKRFQSICVSSGCEDSPCITVHQHHSLDEVRNFLSDLKKQFKSFCEEEFNKIPTYSTAVNIIPLSEPKSREDFLKYFFYLSLDPNTANKFLQLSEKNRVVIRSEREQSVPDHPERFSIYRQVLCKESVCGGRCYWEVEWSNVKSNRDVHISVSYKDISRKGRGKECEFGRNSQSWSLCCSSSSFSFCHNNIETKLEIPSSSTIGVYVDHSAGALSFYSVFDTMRLLHRVHSTFTQPLYAGFGLGSHSAVSLCKPK